MKQTNDKYFLDSNIIVYAHTDLEPQKQKMAQQIIAESQTVISTQVIQETANILVKKFKHSWVNVSKVATEAIHNNTLHINTDSTILDAFRIAERYGFSLYDSLIISAALESNCNILYSEDMQHNQIIANRLKVVNPFA
jgi:predicted nucleic acid-binding protein